MQSDIQDIETFISCPCRNVWVFKMQSDIQDIETLISDISISCLVVQNAVRYSGHRNIKYSDNFIVNYEVSPIFRT